jgi:hypothetical protein
LTLEQQGLFALGYYHQHAENRAAAKAAAERRAQGSVTGTNGEEPSAAAKAAAEPRAQAQN